MKKYIRVQKATAQSKIRDLKARGEIDSGFRIYSDESYVYVPVKDSYDGPFIFRNEDEAVKKETVSGSFDVVGSIAITKNDDPDFAEKILKTINSIKSVYYDSGVTGKERIRSLRLLAGSENTVTLYRENGCVFKVDVAHAYFSPRLATERMRLSDEISDGEFVIDMFSGIGTISIEIAKKRKAEIVSMDINPAAIDLLKENTGLNRLKGHITPQCGDSRLLISSYKNVDRVIMNNPTGSSQFIDSAVNSLKNGGIINYYEIASPGEIENRIKSFKTYGLSPSYMRKVHGYSSASFLYSVSFILVNP
ncbi:MAG: class I SAM-dependent methyltransferase [Thermoplasmata archaeon]